MAAIDALFVKLSLDLKDFEGGLKKVSSKLSKAGEGFVNLGKKIALGVTLPIVAARAAMIKLASDAVETENKFKQVMGKMSNQAEGFVDTFSRGLGRNKTDVRESLSAFQSFTVGLGFGNAEALKMSTRLTELSTDFASFNNLSDTEGLQRFISAMSGSSEVVDRFGINLKESALGLKLLELGFEGSSQKATEQQKAMARLAIIAESLGRQGAIGDAQRTMFEFAGSLKRLQAAVKTAGESLGKILLPQATKLLNKIIPLIKRFNEWTPEMKETALRISVIAAAIGPLLIGIGGLTIGMSKLFTAAQVLIGALKFLGLASLPLLAALLLLGVAVISVIGAWDDLVNAGKMIWQSLKGIFEKGAQALFEIFIKPWIEMGKALNISFKDLADGTKGFVETMLSILINLPRIIANKVVGGVVKALNGLIKSYNFFAKKFGQTEIKEFTAIKFKDDFKVQFDQLEEIATDGMKAALDKTELVFDQMGSVASQAGETFANNFKNGLGKIGGVVGEFGKGIISKGLGALSPGFDPTKQEAPSTPLGAGGVPQQGPAPGEGFNALIQKGIALLQKAKLKSAEVTAAITENWLGFDSTMEGVMTNFQDISQAAFQAFSDGFASAVTNAILFGESFSEAMKTLFLDIAQLIIKTLIKMGVQAVATSLISSAASKTAAVADINASAGRAFAAAFASIAAIPIIGPALAPAAAALAGAGALGGLAFLGAFKDGGIVTQPGLGLIGEAGPEAVIPLDQLDQGGGDQTIIIELDGREIAKSTVKNMPSVVRFSTGATF